MKNRSSFSRSLCLVLTLALAFGGMLIPSSAAALQKSECDAIERLNNAWFYVPSTVPADVGLRDWTEWTSFDHYDSKTNQYKTEMGKTCSITFVKGDEALKDALQYKEYTTSFYDGGVQYDDYHMLDLFVDNDQLKAPGTAVFRVKITSEHYSQDAEVTLRVLSWEDYPLLAPSGTPVMNVQTGDIVEERQIAEAALALKDAEVIAALEAEGVKGLTAGVVNEFVIISDRESDPGFAAQWDNMAEVSQAYAGGGYVAYRSGYQIMNYGSGKFRAEYRRGNIDCEKEITLVADGYRLDGPGLVKAGESAQYSVISSPAPGRTFACSAEGRGVTLDPETLVLTVAEGTPDGTEFTVTAVPSDGGEPAVLKGKVGSGVIAMEELEAIPFYEGFSIALPADQQKFRRGRLDTGEVYAATRDETGPYMVVVSYKGYLPMDEFAEEADVANRIYDIMDWTGLNIAVDKRIDKDGHPIRMIIGRTEDGDPMGVLEFARNNRFLRTWCKVFALNNTPQDEVPDVTEADMEALAAAIVYDPASASVVKADGEITLTNKDEATLLTAGKKLVLKAAFANPDRVNKKEKNDTLEWTLTDTETGAEPEGFKLDGKSGTLTAPKNLEKVYSLEVKAASPIFHTEAVYPVTVLPAVAKVIPEPAELTFYAGTDTAQEVRAVLEPDTVPPVGITWKLKKEGIVEMTAGEDGTASFRPVAAGKTGATVAEPGGKKAEVKISVIEPVAEVQLAMSGKQVPGGKVTVKATVLPKNAGNKNVEWTLDVGEEVATVKNGQVVIAKDAAPGTVITVTCTAPGAPEPVQAAVQIEVAEK